MAKPPNKDQSTLEELQEAHKKLTEQIEQAKLEAEADQLSTDPEGYRAHVNEIIKTKGLKLQYAGDGIVVKTKSYDLVLSGREGEAESNHKAAPIKRKRTLEDYRPTDEELASINKLSNVDHRTQDLYVFEPMSANTEVDRDFEFFKDAALEDGARMTPDNPTQLDHDRTIRSTIGKLVSGRVANKKLYQKFYVLDTPGNQELIKHIAGGVYNKVSVSFGAEIKDYECSACGRPIISDACPHRPGMMDDKSAKIITVAIKRMAQFYELSLVWLPAQYKAGIRRQDVPTSSSTADAGGSKAAESPNASDSTEDPARAFDRIPNEKSLATEGDTFVDEAQKKAAEEAAAKEAAEKEVADKAAADKEAAEKAAKEAAEKDATEKAAKEAADKAAAEKAAAEEVVQKEAEQAQAVKAAASKEVLVDSVKAIKEAQEALTTQVASLVELAKANAEALVALKGQAQISKEEIVQGVLASLPAIDEEAPATKSASNRTSLTDMLRSALNETESQ